MPCNASDPSFPRHSQTTFCGRCVSRVAEQIANPNGGNIHSPPITTATIASPLFFHHISLGFSCARSISLLFPTTQTGLNAYKSARTGANESLWRFWLSKPPTHTDVIGRKLRPQSARKDASGVIYGPSNISIYHIYNRTQVR